MSKPLRILMVEDSEDDVQLTIQALKKGGYEPTCECVEDAEAMQKALVKGSWDVILCDYQMPKFDGIAAIALLKKTGLDIPLIIVSGAIGEETAVECMRYGAKDYVMKGNLSRLIPSIERELREEAIRRASKLASEELRESEEKYRFLAETMVDMVWMVNMDLQTTYVSPSIFRVLGFTQKERMKQALSEIMTPKSIERATETFILEMERARKEGFDPRLSATLELEYYHKDGSTRWFENVMSFIGDDQGNLIGIRGVSRDITERKRADDNIKKLTDAMESAIDGMALLNQDGEYIYLNQAHARIYGYENAGELIGKSWRTLYDADEIKRFDAEIMPNFGQKGYWQGRAQGIKKDGSKFPQEISLTALGSGGLICVVRDITDHMRAEEALRASEDRSRRAVEYAPFPIMIHAEDGEVIAISQGWTELSGYTHSDIPTIDNWTERAYGFRKQKLKEEIDTLYGLISRKDEGEYTIVGKDGTKCVWDFSSAPLGKLLDGRRAVISMAKDITERKKAEKQLQDNLESLRRAVNTTIQVMVSAVEVRDPYTSGHQTRSADLARAIATEMGLSQEKIEGIRMAGSIHDIGKLSIPAEILAKPTKLSEIEFSLIKEHPHKGFEMLKDVESPWPLAEIIYQHHERMDGSGYPRNLKGEEICMEARILSVADVVEAMASHRPYRAGLGIDAALNEIETNRDIFYDDTVADACLRLFREKGFQLATASI